MKSLDRIRATLLSGLLLFGCASSALAQPTETGDEPFTNPLSQFPITVDGRFTDGISGGEWSDVRPAWFVSPPLPQGEAEPTFPNNPLANSLLYAAVAPGATAPSNELYLLTISRENR